MSHADPVRSPAARPDPSAAGNGLPRAFIAYLGARALASLAIQMQVVAVGWQVYALTDSPLQLGYVGLVQFAPSLLLLFVTGPVIDHFDRRAVLMLFRLVEAAASASLAWHAWHGSMTPAHIFGAVFVIGAARAFEMPAGQALVPRLVAPHQLQKAIALSTSTNQLATITGPALGGLLYLGGPEAVYLTSSALFCLASAAMLGIRERRTDAGSVRKIDLEYIFGGFRFIRSRPVVLGAASLDMVAVLLGGATALLPIYARDVLHTGPQGLGLLRSAPAAGALLAALWLARHPLRRHVGRRMLQAVAGFGLATLVFAFSPWLWLSAVALFVTGATDMVSVVVRQTLIQLDTPDQMRGRVSSVNSIFIGASNQIGEFESGVLAAWLGAVPSVALGAIGTLVVVSLWSRWFPALRDRDEPGGGSG